MSQHDTNPTREHVLPPLITVGSAACEVDLLVALWWHSCRLGFYQRDIRRSLRDELALAITKSKTPTMVNTLQPADPRQLSSNTKHPSLPRSHIKTHQFSLACSFLLSRSQIEFLLEIKFITLIEMGFWCGNSNRLWVWYELGYGFRIWRTM